MYNYKYYSVCVEKKRTKCNLFINDCMPAEHCYRFNHYHPPIFHYQSTINWNYVTYFKNEYLYRIFLDEHLNSKEISVNISIFDCSRYYFLKIESIDLVTYYV